MRLNFSAVSTDTRKARLTVRDRESDARTDIQADSWEFVDERTIRLRPAGTNFAPYKIYEVWYDATGSVVIGIGFAATRDLVSFLRYESVDRDGTRNPMIAEGSDASGTGIAHTLAFGVSQSVARAPHAEEPLSSGAPSVLKPNAMPPGNVVPPAVRRVGIASAVDHAVAASCALCAATSRSRYCRTILA